MAVVVPSTREGRLHELFRLLLCLREVEVEFATKFQSPPDEAAKLEAQVLLRTSAKHSVALADLLRGMSKRELWDAAKKLGVLLKPGTSRT